MTSRLTLVERLRISTVAPDTATLAGSVTTPTIEPSSNCGHMGAESKMHSDTTKATRFIITSITCREYDALPVESARGMTLQKSPLTYRDAIEPGLSRGRHAMAIVIDDWAMATRNCRGCSMLTRVSDSCHELKWLILPMALPVSITFLKAACRSRVGDREHGVRPGDRSCSEPSYQGHT